jgi:predicted ArsR family transcriptional regulator
MRRREGRGRPEKVYAISRAALGDNLSALSEALWTEAGSSVRVEALARRLAGDIDFKAQPVARRLNLLVGKLNGMNYHARWEAGAGGPRILFGHCPYAAILAKRPELCKMDAALLRELFGDEFEQIAWIEKSQGLCIFVTR